MDNFTTLSLNSFLTFMNKKIGNNVFFYGNESSASIIFKFVIHENLPKITGNDTKVIALFIQRIQNTYECPRKPCFFVLKEMCLSCSTQYSILFDACLCCPSTAVSCWLACRASVPTKARRDLNWEQSFKISSTPTVLCVGNKFCDIVLWNTLFWQPTF